MSAAAEAKGVTLKEMTERGDAGCVSSNPFRPLCLELANEVLSRAEKEFEKVDRTILFTMADHLDFGNPPCAGVGEQISNPLTDDIRVMFL